MSKLFTDAKAAAEVLHDCTKLNHYDPIRNKSLLELPANGELVMTGDLHGHMRNFQTLQRFCSLNQYPQRHVILHELIHRESDTMAGEDDSIETLLLAAEYKCDYPGQVHFLQSNHELSQLTGNIIVKLGRNLLLAFEESLRKRYAPKHELVSDAVREYISSLPLAARTQNGVFCSHSLPAPKMMPGFDPSVLARDPRPQDWLDGDVYKMVWGRNHTREMLDEFASLLGVDWFLAGHTPQDDGFGVYHDRMLVLASDHNQGVFLPFDLSRPTSLQELVGQIRKFGEYNLFESV